MPSHQEVYAKLKPSGLLDKGSISQSDHDLVVNYIKKSFPKAKSLQRDIEQTLKRTFVLGSGSNSSFAKSFIINRNQTREKKKNRRSLVKPVPKKLPYEHFLKLNQMWSEYIADLLRDCQLEDLIQQRLSKADLHGALITVDYAHCKTFVGMKGIVIKETKNTFVIVSEENITKTIPKAEGTFRIELTQPHGSMIIAGNSFLTRPAERASKKIKSFMDFVGSKTYRSTLKYTKTS